MQASRPVDCDVAFAPVEPGRTLHTTTGADSTELKEPIEDRAIVPDIIFRLIFSKVIHVIGSNFLQEINVFVGMILCHLEPGSRLGPLYDMISNRDSSKRR